MAAKLDPQRRAELRRAISNHIREYGRTEWWRVSEQFPDVTRRTISRLARRFEATDPETELEETVTEVQLAVDRQNCSAQTEPQASSEAPRSLALLDKFHAVWERAEQQRRHALVDGRIRNTDLHHKSLELQSKLVNIGNRLASSIYTIERMERMRAAIIEAIRQADPDTARRVVKHLLELHERYGLSGGE
jgi:hypothetical protein